jgi:hypothetical protein
MLNSIKNLKDISVKVESFDEVSWKRDFEYCVLRNCEAEAPRPEIIDPYGLCGIQIKQWTKTAPSQGQTWACYFSNKICVSGIGSLCVDDVAVLDGDLVATYWKSEYTNPKYSNFLQEQSLPVREVNDMCVCAISWGWNIYGHFLIDALPRLLAIKTTFGKAVEGAKILLRDDTPEWFTRILIDDLNFDARDFEYFNPKVERILLKRGIFPAYGYQRGFFQPSISGMFNTATSHFHAPEKKVRKIFISRARLPEHRKNIRGCKNETELCEVANKHFGYEIFIPEENDWRTQIETFRASKLVVGLAGSGLHTSIFCDSSLIVGFVGAVNLAQCHIASLTQQKFGALIDGVTLGRNFEVNVNDFQKFLDGLEQQKV